MILKFVKPWLSVCLDNHFQLSIIKSVNLVLWFSGTVKNYTRSWLFFLLQGENPFCFVLTYRRSSRFEPNTVFVFWNKLIYWIVKLNFYFTSAPPTKVSILPQVSFRPGREDPERQIKGHDPDLTGGHTHRTQPITTPSSWTPVRLDGHYGRSPSTLLLGYSSPSTPLLFVFPSTLTMGLYKVLQEDFSSLISIHRGQIPF